MEGFTKYLSIADAIDIMIFKENGDSITLPAFVYDVRSNTELVLSHPISEGQLYTMSKHSQYYFRFFIENNGMYLFKGILKEKIQFDNLPSVVIEMASDIKKVQRRKFFRVNYLSVGAIIETRKRSEEEIEIERERIKKKFQGLTQFVVEEEEVTKLPFDTIDLSGGGIRFRISKAFEVGDVLKGEFKMATDWIFFKGEVTRVEKKDSNAYEVGIKFIDLDASAQSKIIGYVFEVERNLIKKGLM